MSDFVLAIGFSASGVLALILALLLKLGKVKPGSIGASRLQTPLGGLLLGIGFLGFGLLNMAEELVPIGIVALLMIIVGIGGGLWIENKARKTRLASSGASQQSP